MIGLMLVAAHMAGDFLFQTKWMADNKMKMDTLKGHLALMLHCWVYSFCFIPVVIYAKNNDLVIDDTRGFYFLLTLSHMITDCRRWASGDDWAPKPILVDQAIHVITLAVLGAMFFKP